MKESEDDSNADRHNITAVRRGVKVTITKKD